MTGCSDVGAVYARVVLGEWVGVAIDGELWSIEEGNVRRSVAEYNESC